MVSIFPDLSRVVHIGDCGTHHKLKNCHPNNKTQSLLESYNNNKQEFFPHYFNLTKVYYENKRFCKPNGGWADPRDHLLCKSFSF